MIDLSQFVGKYVIVRSRSEGINSGYVVAAAADGVILREARRLWYHKPAGKSSWYEGVALHGLHPDSKISDPVDKAIIEDYSITLCTQEAIESIKAFKSHEQ